MLFLRGINVGGKYKIDMKLLKKSFKRVGVKSVVTYIHSGNSRWTFKKGDHLYAGRGDSRNFGLQLKC